MQRGLGAAARGERRARARLSAPSAWTTAAFARSLWLRHSDNGAEKRPQGAGAPGARGRPDAGSPAGPGVTASFSRHRASNDNPCCESLFRTLKTRHDYPALGKDHEEQARSCDADAVS